MRYQSFPVESILAALDKKKEFSIEEICFDKQLDFINDPARLKALFCTRRAAKSYSGGIYLIREALANPGCNCLFIGLTRLSAHGIVWKDILKEIDLKYKLGIKFNETLLTATLPNGSVIYVAGADSDESEMNKLLGKKYRLVCIDEASMFTVDVRRLVYGILKPAMADNLGTICLLGTASNVCQGLFYDVTTGAEAGWSVHEWSASSNPHIASQWAEELADIDKNRPLFKETALYKQWFLNRWLRDQNALVYKFDKKTNTVRSVPEGLANPHYILAVDLGHSPDPSAFVVCCYYDGHPTLYVVHAEKHLEFDITNVAEKIKSLDQKYKFEVKIVDNSAKQAVAELNNRHNLNLIPADKAGKVNFINLMNDDFIQRRIMLLPGTENLQKELEELVWIMDGDKVKEPKKEHPTLANHLNDALLYGWRFCYNYIQQQEKKTNHINWNNQSDWEPKHIERKAEAIKQQQDPSRLELEFDDGLFDDDFQI